MHFYTTLTLLNFVCRLVSFMIDSLVTLELTAFYVKSCLIIINRIDVASNEAVGSYSIKIFNDNIHDTWMNTCWNLRRVVEKMKTEIKIFMPQDDNDKEFRKQIFQVTVDSEKAIDSIYNNYMTKTIMKGIFDSMDFDMPKFPLQKVFCFSHFEFD